MIASSMLVGKKKPDEMWMTPVTATKPLKHLDLSFVFAADLCTKFFDGKVRFLCPLFS